MKEILEKEIKSVLEKLGVNKPKVNFDYPAHIEMGDCSSNVAMVYAKELGKKPMNLAKEIASPFLEVELPSVRVEVAPPGFINFFFDANYFVYIFFIIFIMIRIYFNYFYQPSFSISR